MVYKAQNYCDDCIRVVFASSREFATLLPTVIGVCGIGVRSCRPYTVKVHSVFVIRLVAHKHNQQLTSSQAFVFESWGTGELQGTRSW